MFDKDSLDLLLSQSAKLAEKIDEIAHNQHFGTVPIVPLPKNMELHSLEKFLPAPTRFRGRYTTESVASWVNYVKQNQTDAQPLQVFVGLKPLLAYAIFDIGTRKAPGHGEHTAQVTLEKTPAYTALLAINGNRQTQQQIAEWLEEWREYLTPVADIDGSTVDAGDIKRAVNAVRHIDIKAIAEQSHKIENFGAQKTALERIEASSTHTLPWGFDFTCAPHKDLTATVFRLRLSLITGDKPQLILRCVNLETEQENIALEFADTIKVALQDQPGVSVYIGAFK